MADFSNTVTQAMTMTKNPDPANPLVEQTMTMTQAAAIGSGSELVAQTLVARQLFFPDGNQLAGSRYRR